MSSKLIFLFALNLILLFFSVNIISQNKKSLEVKALKLHKKILKIDTHTDTPLRFFDLLFDLRERHNAEKTRVKIDIPKIKEGEINSIFFAAFIGQGPRDEDNYLKAKERIEQTIQLIHKNVEKHSDDLILATSTKEILKAYKKKKVAILIGIENGYGIGKDLSLIEKFYKSGARYITLCHTKNNDICDSSTDPNGIEHNGLSEFGKEVIREMNRLGMMIDISHVSDKAALDVLSISKLPVIASHSCVKGIYDNPRNISDEILLKIKENRGVVQVCIYSGYLKELEKNPVRDSLIQQLNNKYNDPKEKMPDSLKHKYNAELYEINEKFPAKLATVSDFVDHIDYIVKKIGIDYVGIGTDFDGGGGVIDCIDISEISNITLELVKRGYSDSEIQKIWSKNFLRVFKANEKKSLK